MSIGPWAMLMTRITPKMRARPSATIAYSVPESSPEITTCPIIAGVMTTFIEEGTGTRASPRPCPDAISRELGLSADQSPDHGVAPPAPGLRHARAPTRFHVSLVFQPIRVPTTVWHQPHPGFATPVPRRDFT